MQRATKGNPVKHLIEELISRLQNHFNTRDNGETCEPLLNIGISTGLLNGLFFVDVDGKEGSDTLQEWIIEFKDLPAQWQVETGNGFHLYYKNPKGL